MRRFIGITICIALTTSIAFPGVLAAQQAAPATLWSFLGIPQASKSLSDNLLNRGGNNPQMERKPPMKKIADPENLKSDNPSVKKAAEVKQQEDAKGQKIKAVKYLASIGCGCYNRDGSITDALLASMGDCTEEVRYETIRAISNAARTEVCSSCRQRSCCSEEISQKLYELAYEKDESGCNLEPSQRVRQAAIDALATCCPGGPSMSPSYDAQPEQQLEPEGPAEPNQLRPEGPVPTPAAPSPSVQPSASDSQAARSKSRQNHTLAGQEKQDDTSSEGVRVTISSNRPVTYTSASFATGTAKQASDSKPDRQSGNAKRSVTRPNVSSLRGSVTHVDREGASIEVSVEDGSELTTGDRIVVYHEYLLSGRVAVGEYVVSVGDHGTSRILSTDGGRAPRVAPGDDVVISR